MIDSEEGGTTVLVCNRTSCKRYYNWEYFRKTVRNGFVVQNQKLEIVRSKNMKKAEGFSCISQTRASI